MSDEEEEIQVGDTVRVSREFVVEVRGGQRPFTSFGPDQISLYSSPKWKIELVRKHQPQVGDVIPAKKAWDLPVGSVVLYEPGGGASVRVNKTYWSSAKNGTYQPNWGDDIGLKILHVGNG